MVISAQKMCDDDTKLISLPHIPSHHRIVDFHGDKDYFLFM